MKEDICIKCGLEGLYQDSLTEETKTKTKHHEYTIYEGFTEYLCECGHRWKAFDDFEVILEDLK